MKFSAQEEYGIRCLIYLGKAYFLGEGKTIPEISKTEKISQHNVAKLLRTLRIGGFLESERGHTGGYTLARPPEQINIGEVLNTLGGKLFDEHFCKNHSGFESICTHSPDCSTRSLWTLIQDAIDNVVYKLTLQDLLGSEEEVKKEAKEKVGSEKKIEIVNL